ncbi:ABC transporter permease [Paenibacillus kobensis]|uniref:ABC transporter permease n=1 Tax=Paenibacillus kobensis TaxID=59841 RepID=UPI000FDA0048|nr:ABC transporter permease subunit [Paenibacillus kobensis]
MAIWLVLVRKEVVEALRSMKAVWLPLVFILLGAMQPITSYYMPEILKHAGNMPEGSIIQIPVPSAGEVLAQTLSQYGTLGLLIVALAFMGMISSEINSGTASFTLVKPVGRTSFFLSKWAAALLLVWLSFAAGFGASWYYTVLLIGAPDAGAVVQGFLLYGLWLSFVVTLTLLFSSLLRSPAGAAFASLGTAAVLAVASSLFPHAWQPGLLAGIAAEAVQAAANPKATAVVMITAAATALAAVLACLSMKRKALP